MHMHACMLIVPCAAVGAVVCGCRCYQAAVEGAEAEHAARRRLITRVLQDLHACLEVRVASTALTEQPLALLQLVGMRSAQG